MILIMAYRIISIPLYLLQESWQRALNQHHPIFLRVKIGVLSDKGCTIRVTQFSVKSVGYDITQAQADIILTLLLILGPLPPTYCQGANSQWSRRT